MGFDPLMLWFNHFCVKKSRIICSVKNTLGTAPTVCIRQDASSTPITVIDRVVELGGCTTATLDPKLGYGEFKKLSFNLKIPKLQGVDNRSIMADSTLRGDAATSPTELTYYHITMWDTQAVTGSMEVDVIIEFVATFTEPRDNVESLTRGHIGDMKLPSDFACPHRVDRPCTCEHFFPVNKNIPDECVRSVWRKAAPLPPCSDTSVPGGVNSFPQSCPLPVQPKISPNAETDFVTISASDFKKLSLGEAKK